MPSQPTDVRPVVAWNKDIFATLASRRQVKAEEIANPQTLFGAEAFAQDQRASVQPALTQQEIDALSDKTAAFTQGQPPDALGDMGQIAEAVAFLVQQRPRAYTHELVVTPAGETWVP